ncbi:hypothetical protein LCGC14_2005050 [marine sediment metagenome]|uniref:Uncharacterized protein n=1 Tax=marine sediment metagenome TaxID=412755 RepID=A0A0F9HZ33_9ZZZZ
MKLWKIEKCEQHERSCVCCEGKGLHVYHTEHQVLSLDEYLGIGITKDLEVLKAGDDVIFRITLVDDDVKIEDGT